MPPVAVAEPMVPVRELLDLMPAQAKRAYQRLRDQQADQAAVAVVHRAAMPVVAAQAGNRPEPTTDRLAMTEARACPVVLPVALVIHPMVVTAASVAVPAVPTVVVVAAVTLVAAAAPTVPVRVVVVAPTMQEQAHQILLTKPAMVR